MFVGRSLYVCGILESSGSSDWKEAAYEIADALRSIFDEFVCSYVYIEEPTTMHTLGGHATLLSGALPKLFYMVGLITGILGFGQSNHMRYVPVNQWKGNLPKALTTKRVNKKYGTSFKASNKTHNIADAVGIGDYIIGRMIK